MVLPGIPGTGTLKVFIDGQAWSSRRQNLKRLQEFNDIVLLGRLKGLKRLARSGGFSVMSQIYFISYCGELSSMAEGS
jgi:hypothetical protein